MNKLLLIIGIFVFWVSPDSNALSLKDISVGGQLSCYHIDDESSGELELRCTGNTKFGGDKIPVELISPKLVSIGKRHICAATAERVICWGDNRKGQSTPPKNLKDVEHLASGSLFSCAIDKFGKLDCWGDDHAMPLSPYFGSVTKMSAGDSHMCILQDTGNVGKVRCFGDNRHSQIDVPLSLKNPVSLSSGANHNCVIDELEKDLKYVAICWGDKTYGQIYTPAGLEIVVDISTGRNHTCAVDLYQGVNCWGDNSMGQINTPPLPSGKKFQGIISGDYHSCAWGADDLVCWGNSYFKLDTIPEDIKTLKNNMGDKKLPVTYRLAEMGFAKEMSYKSYHSSGYLRGFRYVLDHKSLLSKIGYIAKSSARNIRLAIYSDYLGQPHKLVAQTSLKKLLSGRHEQDIVGGEIFLGPEAYWLMAQVDTNSVIGEGYPGPSDLNCYRYLSDINSPLPSVFGKATCNTTNKRWNYYTK